MVMWKYFKIHLIKVIPTGHKYYKEIKNDVNKTELCSFYDWLPMVDFHKEEDFHCKGFYHLLKRGDWFDKKTGKDIDFLNLFRKEKTVKVDSTEETTEFIWDCAKNFHINEEE